MSLLDYFIPTTAADIVAVYDDQYNQVFADARPMKASIKETSKPMEHPVETGVIITDHKVLQPVEIELPLICGGDNYRDVYQQIRDLYRNSALLVVQTKTDSYANMIITDMPHEEDPALYDAIPIALKLKEVLIIKSTPSYAPREAEHSDTVQRGEQKPTSPKSFGTSFADQVQQSVTGGQ